MTPNWNQLPLDKKEYVNLSADTVNKTVKNIGGSNLLIPMQIEGNIVTVYDRLGNRFYKLQRVNYITLRIQKRNLFHLKIFLKPMRVVNV